MKKFYKILVCLLLCVFSLGFVACGDDERTPEEKAFTYPASGDAVYGNGGLAVQNVPSGPPLPISYAKYDLPSPVPCGDSQARGVADCILIVANNYNG